MKIKLRGIRRIYFNGDFIRLDDLLKLASMVSSGGEAKFLIKAGKVRVGGEPCVMRGKKLRPGDVVRYDGQTLIAGARNARQQPADDGSCTGCDE